MKTHTNLLNEFVNLISYFQKSILLTLSLLFLSISLVKADNPCDLSDEPDAFIDPIAICVDFTAVLDFSGTKAISPFNVNGGSFDPDGNIIDFSVDPDFFTCDDLGVNVVTLTVEDNDGNTSTCTANVTVVFPGQTLACFSELNLSLGFDGTATLSPEDMLAGPVFDPCDLLSVTPSFFTCADVGQEFLVTVNDASNGNFCWGTVLIEDKIPPTAICNSSVTVNLDIDGNAVITPDMIDAGSFDNCNDLTYELSDSTFDCSNIGNNNVVFLTVTDVGGNTSQCFSIVNVVDNIPLEIIWPADVTLECDGDTDPTTTGEPVIIDNCGIYGYSYEDQVFNLVGNTIKILRTWTVVEWLTGDFFTHVQIIQTWDTQAPIAVCVSDINVSLDQNGMATLLPEAVDAGSFDDCGDVTLSLSPNTFDCSDIGDSIVTVLTVTDESGNTSQCWTNVVVEDKIAPTAVCLSQVTLTLDNDGNAFLFPQDIDAGSYDNCGPLIYELSDSTFDCSNAGDTTFLTLTVTDASGNSNLCWTEVIIQGSTIEAEYIIWPEDVVLACDGDTDPSNTGEPVVINECGIFGVSYQDDIFPLGGNTLKILRTWTIIDWLTGDFFEYIQIIQIQDTDPPIAVCVSDINVSLDQNGMATLPPEAVDAGSFDDCGDVTLSLSPNTFDCSDIGDSIVTVLTVTDESGNTSQCWTNVVVEDKLAPIAICNSQVNVSLGADGTATITPDAIDAGSFDNCGPVILSIDQSTFDCTDIGNNIIVTLTVTDQSGNSNQCWSEIVVEDKLAPTVTCPADLTLDCTVAGDLAPNITGLPTIVDNCDLIGYSYEDQILPLVGNSYKVLRTWTVIDWNNGVIQECIQVITVLDRTPPVMVCLNTLTASLDANGNLTLFPADLDAGTSDACGDVTLTIDKSEFDCSDVGTTPVTLTATDENDNVSQCVVDVMIQGLDADGDGFSICNGDCNDNDGAISPGSPEVCGDNIDNNCNGAVDEDCICSSFGQSTQYEWIESFGVNGLSNNSGNDGGYGDYTSITILANQGTNSIDLTPGFSGSKYKESWRVWIDLNQNGIYENSEKVFQKKSKNPISGTFDIPTSALLGMTTMRVAMKYNQYSDPCEIFPEGEVEDYTIFINEPEYCDSRGESTQYEWIKKVRLKSINNQSGDDGGYADYTNLSTNLNPGQSKNIKLKPGFSGSSYVEYWRVWVDWNEDGDFDDAGELEVEVSSSGNITDQITVPNNASSGNKIMRVSMNYDGYADPCETFDFGEVEDYTIVVTGNNALISNSNDEFFTTFYSFEESDITEEQTNTRDQMTDAMIKLYPNPTAHYINIEVDSPEKSDIELTMFNEVGQQMYRTTFDQKNHKIDVTPNRFVNGLYLIIIQNGDQVISKRIIIAK